MEIPAEAYTYRTQASKLIRMTCTAINFSVLLNIGYSLHVPYITIPDILVALIWTSILSALTKYAGKRSARYFYWIQEEQIAEEFKSVCQQGLYPPADTGTDEDVKKLVRAGYSNSAARLYIEIHDCNLRDALRAISRLRRSMPAAPQH